MTRRIKYRASAATAMKRKRSGVGEGSLPADERLDPLAILHGPVSLAKLSEIVEARYIFVRS